LALAEPLEMKLFDILRQGLLPRLLLVVNGSWPRFAGFIPQLAGPLVVDVLRFPIYPLDFANKIKMAVSA
jgi:hypothetical protein